METIRTMYKPEEVNEDMGSVRHHLIQPTFKHAMKHAKIHQDLDLDGDVDALEKLVPDEVTGTEKNQAMLQKKLKTKYAKEKEHTRVGVAFESKINEQDDKVEKEEMALSQLYFVKYAAEEIIEYIEEYDGEVEEWYQNKLSKVHSDMEGLHSYIEGEKGRLGMEDDEDEEEEDDEEEMEESTNIQEASYRVNVEGLPIMYVQSASPNEVMMNLRKILKKGDFVNSIDRVTDAEVKKAFRLKAIGKDEDEKIEEEVEIDEAKSGTGYELYHKDFSSAMAHAYDFAKKKYGIEVDPQEIDRNVAMGPKKPSSGKANAYRLLDKTGKKAIQVQVTNLDNKRYELNMYKEEIELDEAAHKVSVTVSDPNKNVTKEETTPPFTPDKKKPPIATPGKAGYGPSAAKHLAKTGMKKQQEKPPMKTEDVEIEDEMINEDIMKLDPITNTLVGLAVAAGVAMYAFDFWFGKDDYEKTRKPIQRGMDKAEKAGNAKLYHSLAAKYYEDQVTKYTKALDKLRNSPNTFYKKDSLKTGAKKGEMKKFEKRAEEELLRVLEIAKKKQKEFEEKEKSGAPISKKYYESVQQKQETLSIEETIKRVVMGEKLHPNQKKLDVDGDGDIEGDDLADLRAGKHKKKEEKKSGGKEQIDVKPKLDEEEMSDADMKKREEIVKSLKKRTQDFKDRYGDRWKEVMYATATKMAMKD